MPMRTLRRAVVASLLLAFALAPTGPAAARQEDPAATRYLVVRGSASAFTTIRLDSKIKLLADRSIIRSNGTYAGYVLQRIGKPGYLSGMFAMPAIDDTYQKFAPQSIFDQERAIPAGAYRLYLVGDGRTEIRIPALGLQRSLEVRPDRKVVSDGGLHELGDMPSTQDRIQVDITPKSVLFGGFFQATDQHQVTTIEQCLTDPGGIQCVHDAKGTATGGAAVLSPGNITPGHILSWSLLANPQFDYKAKEAPGRYDIFQRFAASVSSPTARYTFWIQLELR